MKTLAIISAFLFSTTLGAQTKNEITETDRLATLGKVWGFLKYYHSNVGKSNIDWDDKLIQTIPKVKKAKTKAAFSEAIDSLIISCGTVKPNPKKFIIKSDRFGDILPIDFEWINESSVFTKSISDKLNYVLENFKPHKNKYIGTIPFVDVPRFNKDKKYKETIMPDEGIRLLALFRYWNIINYFYPYKNVIGENWDGVLDEFVPKFIAVTDTLEYYRAVRELVCRINDTHAYVRSSVTITKDRGYSPPFGVCYVENKTVISKIIYDSLPDKSIKIGDELISIDGVSCKQQRDKRYKYTEGSNEAARNRNIDDYLLEGVKNTPITVEILTEKGIKIINTKRSLYLSTLFYYNDKKEPLEILDDSIIYVRLNRINKKTQSKILNQYKNYNGLILDMRRYNRYRSWSLLKKLATKRDTIAVFQMPSAKKIGQYKNDYGYAGSNRKESKFKGTIVLLINECTQSAGEFYAMGCQRMGITLIGNTTAGADGNVSKIYLPGIKTKISGLGVYYPDGRETQRIGIVADIKVEPTIEGIKEGRDEVLERAIEYINTGE